MQHVDKTDAATRLDIIALKAHVTQLTVNQAEMVALQTQGHKFPELVKLLANQANTFLLTIDGAVRSDTDSCTSCKKDGHTSDRCWFCAETKFRDAVKHVTEAKMILKTKKRTIVEKRALVAAQQNSYQ